MIFTPVFKTLEKYQEMVNDIIDKSFGKKVFQVMVETEENTLDYLTGGMRGEILKGIVALIMTGWLVWTGINSGTYAIAVAACFPAFMFVDSYLKYRWYRSFTAATIRMVMHSYLINVIRHNKTIKYVNQFRDEEDHGMTAEDLNDISQESKRQLGEILLAIHSSDHGGKVE